jgi:hypothetical protein
MGSLADDLRAALDPARLFAAWGLEPESWQEDVLRSRPPRALLLCCRQAGKSSTAAAAACHEAIYTPGSLSLMLAPTQRQSSELLRKARSLLSVASPTLELEAILNRRSSFRPGRGWCLCPAAKTRSAASPMSLC